MDRINELGLNDLDNIFNGEIKVNTFRPIKVDNYWFINFIHLAGNE